MAATKVDISSIAKELYRQNHRDVTAGHLRNVAAPLWKAISTVVETKIEKDNVVDELRRWYRK